MIAAVIPTLYHPRTLAPLVEVLKADGVDVILIDTKGREPAIYQWWNEGVRDATRRGATEIAVLNDDIAILPGTLPMMARALQDDPKLGVVSPFTGPRPWIDSKQKIVYTTGLWYGPSRPGMAGHAFMFRADLNIPFDETYHWYAGDDRFEEDVRAAGLKCGVIRGLCIRHLGNHSGKQRFGELEKLIQQDRRRWHTRNDPGRSSIENAYLNYRSPRAPMTASSIPNVLHRIAIGPVPGDSQRFWEGFRRLHPDWTLTSHEDPFDPDEWPLTSWTWPHVIHPAQQADYMRLELLWHHGGVYVDWDMEPYRPLDPFLPLQGFAAYDSPSESRRPTWIGTGVLGFRPHHPAMARALDIALERFVLSPRDIMAAGPMAMTTALQGRDDVLLLPFGTFYSGEWSQRDRMKDGQFAQDGWAYAHHRMHASWMKNEVPAPVPAQPRPRWRPREVKW